MHVDLALLKQLLVSSPAVVGLSREQVPPRAWPGIVFVPAANSDPPLWGDAECPFQCLFSPQPSCDGWEVMLLWKLWCFDIADFGPFEFQLNTNSPHGREGDLWGHFLGGLRGICCAKEIVSLWLVLVKRSQLLLSWPLFFPDPLPAVLPLWPTYFYERIFSWAKVLS